MMKKRKVNYPLAVILSVFNTLLPVGAFFFLCYAYLNKLSRFYTISKALMVFSFGLFLFLRLPLKRMLNQAVLDNEYDENGVSKKKKFENLTREQREAMDLQKAAQMESLLPTNVIEKIKKEGSKTPEKDLNGLIGLAPVKQKVTEMVARMEFEKADKKRKKKSFAQQNSMSGRHFCFFGSAGTGKTTVARIITGFLYKYGYIKQNKCIEIDGNFLKAGADSAAKTKLIIQKAYGGVLFIDEAYTIIDGAGGFGNEVIATLIKEMEDNRDKLVVIIAGYKADIKRLLDSNEGFKSRIKEYLEFTDYNTMEMKDIFVSMAHSEGFAVSGEALDNFEIRCEKERKLSSFGNGRTARNILDESIDRHALNYGKDRLVRTDVSPDGEKTVITDRNKNKYVLCGCDVSISVNKAVLA